MSPSLSQARTLECCIAAISGRVGLRLEECRDAFAAFNASLCTAQSSLSAVAKYGASMLESDTSFFTLKLGERIVKTLQSRYRRTGRNEPVTWRGIWIELGSTEEDFCKALDGATRPRGRAQIVFTDSDHIKLASEELLGSERTGRSAPRLPLELPKEADGLRVRLIRFFLPFGRSSWERHSTTDGIESR